jgi:hypothetical protein
MMEESKVMNNCQLLQNSLIDIAVNAIESMYNTESKLFSYRRIINENVMVNEGLSIRYTIIVLLGISRLKAQGKKCRIDMETVLAPLIDSARKMENIGDVGLLLWLCSMTSPNNLNKLLSELDIPCSLSRYRDYVQGSTMELSWFLSGLSHAALSRSKSVPDLEALATTIFKKLMGNYDEKGIFRHKSKSYFPNFFRNGIGNFADQVYSIYALAKFSKAFSSKKALNISSESAETICRLQGPQGQWWWHYDAAMGRVIGSYPVFSVHQYGMAPMALSALSEITGQSFSLPISKGLQWLTGENELGYNMIDASRNIIWRGIGHSKLNMCLDRILSLADINNIHKYNIKIIFECRPYCFGWLLYGLA